MFSLVSITGADLDIAEAMEIFKSFPIVIENLDEERAYQIEQEFQTAGCITEIKRQRTHSYNKREHSSPVSQNAKTSQGNRDTSASASDVSSLSRADILPVLFEIDELSQECFELSQKKKIKEEIIARETIEYEKIINHVTLKTRMLSFILACIGVFVPPIIGVFIVLLIIEPKMYKKDRENNSKMNFAKAEEYKKIHISPYETKRNAG